MRDSKIKITAGKIREEHPRFSIYTTSVISTAIGNVRAKLKKELEKQRKSELRCNNFHRHIVLLES